MVVKKKPNTQAPYRELNNVCLHICFGALKNLSQGARSRHNAAGNLSPDVMLNIKSAGKQTTSPNGLYAWGLYALYSS